MSNIEDIINTVKQNDIEIPLKIQNRINYTLNNKTRKKEEHYLRKIITIIVSLLCTMAGSFGVYALTGGTIEGIPATDWLGIKFSNKYIEYKQPVENQKVAFEDTSVELTSTLCNEGITILEFEIKLSQEDYEKLRIDQSVLTDEYLQQLEEKKAKLISENKINSKSKEEYKNEIAFEYEETAEDIQKEIEYRKNSIFIPALALNYYQVGGTYNYDKFNPNTTWYASIYIDDEPFYVRNWQKIDKISDYEYKVYTMYSITDDVLNGKDNFKITLKNNKLTSIVQWATLSNGWRSECQWFARGESEMMQIPAVSPIDLPGEFEVNVSKNDILNDSIVIENPDIKSEFRNITHKVEKVVASPIQTIVKINHSATQQSSNAYANRYSNSNIEHLPITREYKVYDANGKELSCFSTTNKNTLIYSDGTREDYDPHDIPNKKYSNATWENINYLLIENTDTDYIKIVPVEGIENPVDVENNDEGEIEYEMDPLIINLK